MIRRIHIQRYKSLLDVDLALKPLSVLFGPNAAGKSNFIDALTPKLFKPSSAAAVPCLQ